MNKAWFLGDTSVLDSAMKPLFKNILQFLRKEWFLLVMLVAIALIVILFESFK